MTPLAGRKLLLIGIGFYDYEAAIAAEFRALGAEVWVEDERAPEMRGRLAPLRRRTSSTNGEAQRHHLASILRRACDIGRLDHIVVIKGTLLDEDFLKALRNAQPGARLTSYHWDSMARYPELIRRQALFDRVLTFDHVDAASNPRFLLRPLFYRPELAQGSSQPNTIDICFVGWLHHDRLEQIKTIRDQARDLGLTSFFYLYTGSWTSLKLHFSGQGRDVHARAQGFNDYTAATCASRAILDLPHPRQTGLTMRAIETIGARRKLITTAQDVCSYDFYRPENVAVIDPAKPQIDLAFLAVPQMTLPPDLIQRYSLRTWALDVVGVTEPSDFIETSHSLQGRSVSI